MNGLFYEIFKDELLKEEKIVWTGQPETSVVFTNTDIFLIPLGLFLGTFGVFATFVGPFIKQDLGPYKLSMPPIVVVMLFGIPFLLIALYLLFGRFLWKNYRKKRTYYAVTNMRVIVLTKLAGKSVQAAFIEKIPAIYKITRLDGIGTIRFGNNPFGRFGNTGMEIFGYYYLQEVPVFYDTKDANRVYDIVNGLRKQ